MFLGDLKVLDAQSACPLVQLKAGIAKVANVADCNIEILVSAICRAKHDGLFWTAADASDASQFQDLDWTTHGIGLSPAQGMRPRDQIVGSGRAPLRNDVKVLALKPAREAATRVLPTERSEATAR